MLYLLCIGSKSLSGQPVNNLLTIKIKKYNRVLSRPETYFQIENMHTRTVHAWLKLLTRFFFFFFSKHTSPIVNAGKNYRPLLSRGKSDILWITMILCKSGLIFKDQLLSIVLKRKKRRDLDPDSVYGFFRILSYAMATDRSSVTDIFVNNNNNKVFAKRVSLCVAFIVRVKRDVWIDSWYFFPIRWTIFFKIKIFRGKKKNNFFFFLTQRRWFFIFYFNLFLQALKIHIPPKGFEHLENGYYFFV